MKKCKRKKIFWVYFCVFGFCHSVDVKGLTWTKYHDELNCQRPNENIYPDFHPNLKGNFVELMNNFLEIILLIDL